MIFCLSSQDPNSEAPYLLFSKFAGKKGTPFPISHHFHPEKKSQPFFRVVKPTKEATKLAFIFTCRNTSPHKIDVIASKMSRRWSSNPTGHEKLRLAKSEKTRGNKSTKNNSFPAFKSCRGWNLCQVVPQIQFNASGRSPGQLEENSDFESSLFRMKFEKSGKSLTFLRPRNSSTSSCLISNELRSSRLISCDCRLTTSWQSWQQKQWVTEISVYPIISWIFWKKNPNSQI